MSNHFQACGFEILYASSKKGARTGDTVDFATYPFSADKGWNAYRASLTSIGYFGVCTNHVSASGLSMFTANPQDELEGSKEYQRKETFAKQDYLTTLKEQPADENATELNPALQMDALLRQAAGEEPGIIGEEALRRRCSLSLRPDDSDEWMNISPEQLDSMLAQRQKEWEECDTKSQRPQKSLKQKGSATAEDKLRSFEGLVQDMKSFVDRVSTHKGAEFPDNEAASEMDIDPEAFLDIMKNALLPSDDDDDDGENDSGDEDDEFYSLSEGEEEQDIRSLMEQMDHELSQTKVGQDFEKEPNLDMDEAEEKRTASSGPAAQPPDEFRPVDVDLNLMKNILESLDVQHGLPGPFSNILNEMAGHHK